MKMPVNVFAFMDAVEIFNTTHLGMNMTNATFPIHEITHQDLSQLHSNISRICQWHKSECSSTSNIIVMKFLKMPRGSVGGERFDISSTQGPSSDPRLQSVFDKALDSSMLEFAKLNLVNGLIIFSQNFYEYYTKSAAIGWTADTYPNPCVDQEKCGLANRAEQAFVCDPDSVLKPEQRRRVNSEFRNAGPGKRIYVAIGEPISGDLDVFAKSLFSQWVLECKKHERPEPKALVAIQLAPEWSFSKDLLNATAITASDFKGDLKTEIISIMDNNAMTSISDRLIEVARIFNESWDGEHWHRITSPAPIGLSASTTMTLKNAGNLCDRSLITAYFVMIMILRWMCGI